MIEKPKFWTWAILEVNPGNYKEVLQSRRVNIVPEIVIDLDDPDGFLTPSSSLTIVEHLFAAVVDGSSHLKSLEIVYLKDLSDLDPELLSQALIRLEECKFWGDTCSPLSTVQLVTLFKAIDETNNLKLRALNLPNEDFSEVPPEVLAAALVKLEETDILTAPLKPEHVRSLFTKIVESPVVNIQTIDPSLPHFSKNVPPQLFADALVRIASVDKIKGNDSLVFLEQVDSLFKKIASTDHLRLKELNLSWVNISHISPHIVSEAVVKLDTLSVIKPGLTEETFQRIGQCRDLRLRGLNIKHENLSSMPPSVLVGAILRLKSLTLYCCDLTPSQVTAIFTQLAVSEHHSLRSLNLCNNNLSCVSTEMLVAVLMSGVEDVDFSNTNLTTAQLTGIYTMVADRKSPRLSVIKLSFNGQLSIPPDLLERVGLNQSVAIIFKQKWGVSH